MNSSSILVTGVTRGLGLAVAENLLQRGDMVYGLARQTSPAWEQLAGAYPDQARFQTVDLSSPETLKETLFETFIPLETPLHGLVNNAALAYDDLATNLDLDRLDEMFRVNLYSAMVLSQEVIRRMLLHKIAGSLVHVSSISVHTGYKGLAMYAASKGAIEAYSKNLAREWGSRGIRSNCVVAGFMDTDMNAELSEEDRGRIHRRTALQQATSIDSVASTIAFLLSEESASITGQNLTVDSGTI